MYKVEEYIYLGKDTEYFKNNKSYYVRPNKGGDKTFISSEKEDQLLFSGSLSIQNKISEELLRDFKKTKEINFKNYKEYKVNKEKTV